MRMLIHVTGGETIPRIIIRDPGGHDLYIDCVQVPPNAPGGVGILEIHNVECHQHVDPNPANNYLYLRFPPSPNQGPAGPNDIEIQLHGNLAVDNMIMPHNGGVPLGECTIKIL
jgi:hypothetical protein